MYRAQTWEKSKGFTFLELLIVLLLLSIFLTFASVNWDVMGKSGKDNFLEQFSIEVSLLREDAVSNYENRIIEFDIPNSRIRIGMIEQGKGFVETREIQIPPEYSIKDVVINGDSFSLGKAAMTFYSNGMVDRVLLHMNQENELYTLLINPLTAKVTGENGYTEEISVTRRNNPS